MGKDRVGHNYLSQTINSIRGLVGRADEFIAQAGTQKDGMTRSIGLCVRGIFSFFTYVLTFNMSKSQLDSGKTNILSNRKSCKSCLSDPDSYETAKTRVSAYYSRCYGHLDDLPLPKSSCCGAPQLRPQSVI